MKLAVLSSVLQSIVVGGLGTAIGLAVAFVLSKVMSSLLFGVGPTGAPTVTSTDAFTFATVSIGALAVALLACTFPPGATKVEPLVSLRND